MNNKFFTWFASGLVLLHLGALTAAQAAPGDLDTAFGSMGRVRVGAGGGIDTAYAIARQSDGKIIVGGQSDLRTGVTSDYRYSLARFNANGSVDMTFGQDGVVQPDIHFGAAISSTALHALAVLPDGKILAAGNGGVQTNFFILIKFNANGRIDASFGNRGSVITNFGDGDSFLKAMTVQADGKAILVGDRRGSVREIVMARYNPDGSLDSSFDGDGMRHFSGGYPDSSANAVRMQGTKIVVAGKVNTPGDVLLVRFNPDGSLDSTFDFDGFVVTSDPEDSVASAMTFMATTAGSDAIVLSGYAGSRAAAWSYNLADGSVDTSFGAGGRFVLPIDNTSATGIGIQTSTGVANRIIFSGRMGNNVLVARLLLTGSLDAAFDGDGVAITGINHTGPESPGAAMLVQPADNKIVIAGTFSQPLISAHSDFAVLRYNAAGSLDTAFDGDGLKIQDVGHVQISARSVAIQTDGKIVAAGDRAVIRLNPNGSLDSTFGGGKIVIPFSVAAAAVALQVDGKIVVAGSIFPTSAPASSRLAVARYNPDGSPDSSFGDAGLRIVDNGGGAALAIQPDGKFVVAGNNGAFTAPDFAVYRFNPDGSFDGTFSADGIVVIPVSGGADRASAVALMPSGKIVVAGSALAGTVRNFATVVLNPDGSLDTSFNDDGIVTTSFDLGTSDEASAVAVQAGRILVAGSSSQSNITRMAIARLNVNGSLDPTFDGDGKVITAVGGSNSFGAAMRVQPDNRILLAGWSTTDSLTFDDFTVVRYTPDGSLDPAYGNGGKAIVHVCSEINDGTTAESAIFSDYAHAIALDSSGNAVVTGQADAVFGLIRLKEEPTPLPTATPGPTPTPGTLGNISTRLRVLSGDNALIGGMIAIGSADKRVIIRAIGPSLIPFGVPGALANPTLDLFQGSTFLFSNDDWNISAQQAEIANSGLAPSNDLESAIIWTLTPGQNYTAVVRGQGGGTGVGIVEAYDLVQAAASKLGNISTRGFVDVDDNVMIAGLIAGPGNGTSLKILVRALGPTLSDFGVAGALTNPTLDLVNSSGTVIRSNDNWRDDPQQQAAIQAAGLAPSHDEEAALVETVAPGAYTAVVRGSNRGTGVGLVEAYNIP